MAYGLKIQNPGGGLIIDSEGFGMNYIGTASYYGTTSYPLPSIDPATTNTYDGTSPITVDEYRITSTSDSLIPFLKISTSYTCSLISVSKINSNTWSILVYCNAGGMVVYCFAKTSVAPSGYGIALYNSSGNLTYNFCNAGSPLFFTSLASFPDDSNSGSPVSAATVVGNSLNSYTVPAAFGWNLGVQSYCGPGSPPVPLEINTWQTTSTSALGLKIVSGTLRRYGYTICGPLNFDAGTDVPIADNYFYIPATTVVIVEANNLST